MSTILDAGDVAPDFDLPTDGGGKACLSALKGKKVVLYLYPKDDTSGCTAEAIAFNGLREKFKAAGAVLLGASPDSAASHDKFKQKHDLKFALAADENKTMLETYGVWREKSMYGRKYMGIERSTFLIDRNGKVAKAWRKVSVTGHAAQVLAAAQALG